MSENEPEDDEELDENPPLLDAAIRMLVEVLHTFGCESYEFEIKMHFEDEEEPVIISGGGHAEHDDDPPNPPDTPTN